MLYIYLIFSLYLMFPKSSYFNSFVKNMMDLITITI